MQQAYPSSIAPVYRWLARSGLAVLACVLLAQVLPAQNPQLQTREVFIFSNDLAFVYKSGEVQFRKQRVVLDQVPEALYGTYWLQPGDSTFSITKTEFGTDTIYQRREVSSFFEALKANEGAQALVTYQISGELEDVQGKILEFSPGSDLIRIQQAGGQTTYLTKDQLQKVAIRGETQTSYWDKQLGKATIVEIDTALDTARLDMFYYRRGFSWQPRYALKLLKDTLIQLSMKCVVKNDSESFDSAAVKLVTGQPALNFKPSGMQPPSERLMKAEAPPEPENGGAASAQDNHVFDADTLSIQKGASALVPVLEQQLSAESGYQAELPLHIDTLTGEPLAVTDYQGRVLNTIAFKNETGGPLLAGSVFILDKDNHPMGQNSLPALEAGETAEIPFTPAPEVQLTVSQTVQERERKVRLDDRDGRFDRFLVQGKLSVRNNGDKLRRINVSQPILGQPKITSRARVSDMPSAISGIPQRKLSWNVPVESGGEQTYTFSYEYFVPRD